MKIELSHVEIILIMMALEEYQKSVNDKDGDTLLVIGGILAKLHNAENNWGTK